MTEHSSLLLAQPVSLVQAFGEPEPGLCHDLDICAFLDKVETEVGK